MKFETVLFKDICRLIRGISYKSDDYTTANDTNGKVFINLKCVSADGFKANGIKYYSGKYKDSQTVKGGDVLIANTDLTRDRIVIGNSILAPKTKKQACFSMDLSKIEILKPELIDKKYLYYWLRAPYARNFMINHSDGSTVVHLLTKSIPDMPMPIHDLESQVKIAKILSDIDAKIECNNRTNDNLEEQVSLLYDAWFKNYLKHKGECPKNWIWTTLSNFADVSSGKRPSMKASEKSESTPIPIIGAAAAMGFTDRPNQTGKILVTGRVGTHGIVQRLKYPCWTSDNTLVITSKYYEFTHQILKRIDYSSINRGSTQPLITQGDLKKVSVLLPDSKTLDQFENITATLMDQHDANISENDRLRDLRDTLLPELLNGKIDVSNIEI